MYDTFEIGSYYYRDIEDIKADWQYVWDFEDYSKTGSWEISLSSEEELKSFDQICFWLVICESLPSLTWQLVKNNQGVGKSFTSYFALANFDEYQDEAARRIGNHKDLEISFFVVNPVDNKVIEKILIGIQPDFLEAITEACLECKLTVEEIWQLGKRINTGKAMPNQVLQFIGEIKKHEKRFVEA